MFGLVWYFPVPTNIEARCPNLPRPSARPALRDIICVGQTQSRAARFEYILDRPVLINCTSCSNATSPPKSRGSKRTPSPAQLTRGTGTITKQRHQIFWTGRVLIYCSSCLNAQSRYKISAAQRTPSPAQLLRGTSATPAAPLQICLDRPGIAPCSSHSNLNTPFKIPRTSARPALICVGQAQSRSSATSNIFGTGPGD
jgi:hypothetical protein